MSFKEANFFATIMSFCYSFLGVRKVPGVVFSLMWVLEDSLESSSFLGGSLRRPFSFYLFVEPWQGAIHLATMVVTASDKRLLLRAWVSSGG